MSSRKSARAVRVVCAVAAIVSLIAVLITFWMAGGLSTAANIAQILSLVVIPAAVITWAKAPFKSDGSDEPADAEDSEPTASNERRIGPASTLRSFAVTVPGLVSVVLLVVTIVLIRSGELNTSPKAALPPYVVDYERELLVPEPQGGDDHARGMDLDTLNEVKVVLDDDRATDLITSPSGYLYSAGLMGPGPADRPSPEACRSKAQENQLKQVQFGEVKTGSAICIETDQGRVSWLKLTWIEETHSPVPYRILHFSTVTWKRDR